MLKMLAQHDINTFVKTDYVVVGLGEILWDLLPQGKQLGGAPANFAYQAHALGDTGIAASRIGTDSLATDALSRLAALGLEETYIQRDEQYATGTVDVSIDKKGEPEFTITKYVAWDYIEWNGRLAGLAARADAVCFGSLAQRSPVSRETIRRFVRSVSPSCLTVLDINLRQNFYSHSVLEDSLRMARILKLNREEAEELKTLFSLGGRTQEDWAKILAERFELELVCITRGEAGSVLVADTESVSHPGYPSIIADTIGSGDAFTAALVYHYLRGSNLEHVSEAANRLGAFVAGRTGATPVIEEQVLEEIKRRD